MWIGEAKSGLCCAVLGIVFGEKEIPKHILAFPIHYVHREAAPTVCRVQWYPDIIISELAPYFDVVGIEIEMLQKDSIDVAADGGVTATEDAGDAFELRPYAVLYVDRVTLHQLGRSEIDSLEIGVIRFALLLAHALLLRWLDSVGYGCCLRCRLLVDKQIIRVGRIGAVDSVVAVYSVNRIDRGR